MTHIIMAMIVLIPVFIMYPFIYGILTSVGLTIVVVCIAGWYRGVTLHGHAFRDALESVGRMSERRIIAAADLWLARHPDAAGLDLRYDMVLITPWRLPRHLPDAFRPGWGQAW